MANKFDKDAFLEKYVEQNQQSTGSGQRSVGNSTSNRGTGEFDKEKFLSTYVLGKPTPQIGTQTARPNYRQIAIDRYKQQQPQIWQRQAQNRQQLGAQLGEEQTKLNNLRAMYQGLNNGGVGMLSGTTRREMDRVQQEITQQESVVAGLQKQLDAIGINTNENREKKIADYQKAANEFYDIAGWATDELSAAQLDSVKQRMKAAREEADETNAQMFNMPEEFMTEDRLKDILGTTFTGIGSQVTNAGGTSLAGLSEAEKYRAENPSAGILGERTGPNAPVAGMEDYYAQRAEYAQQENEFDIASAKLEEVADSLGETAQLELARAKGGLGTLGQAGVDLAVNALQMGFDVAVGAPLGGASLVSMFIRTFGDAAREARLDGADVNHQLAYGLTKGGIEVATEKIFDGLAGAFGKGAADDITEKLIQRLTKDDTGRTLLRAIAGAAGEGTEEVLSDLFGVLADKIYKDGTWSELWQQNMDTALYDFLIGAAMGALGGATSLATGQNAQANERLRTVDRAENMLLQRGYDESNARQYGWMAMQQLTGEEMSKADQNRFEGRPTAQAVTTQMANEDTVKTLVGKAKAFQELTDDQREVLTGGYTEGDPVAYLFGAIDAYELGKTGIELDKAFTLAKDGKTLNAVQFRHAWQLGNGQVQTDAAKAAAESASLTAEEAMTEEGRDKLAAQLSMFGEQAETVAGAIQQGQDPAQYRTAMNKAAYMIAANGVDVTEYAKNATDDVINSLTPEQLQLAQEIGSQQHMQNQADAKALADRLHGIRETAEADEGYQNLKEIQKALRDMKADRRAEQKAYYDGLAKLQEMNKNGIGETEAYKTLYDETQQHKENVSQIDDVMKMLQDQRGELKVTPGKVVFAEQDGEAGGVKYKAVDQSKLTRTQKGTLALAEKLAEVAGLEIRVVDMGKGYGGEYVGNGVIYLNINAQFNGKNIAVGSLTHEVTHFLKEYAPEEYALLKDVVIQEIAKDPKTFSSIISDRTAAQMNLTPDTLTDEMVANACMTIFQDSEAVKRIVNENRTLAEKIIDFLNEIISNIKAAFSEMDTKDNFTLYKEVRAVENQMEQIRDLWLQAFNEAAENRSAEQAVAEAENNTAAVAESTTNLQKWEGEEPKKTQYGFKLMNVDENGLPHAMFIDAAKPYEFGVWYAADSPKMANLIKLEPGYAYLVDENDMADMATRMPVKKVTRVSKTGKKSTSWQGLPGKKLVNNATAENKRWMIVDQYADGSKSIHNVGINGSDTVSTFALRPGIHAVDIPSMSHIGAKSEGAAKIDTRRPNQRWFLIEYPVDQDYNQEAYAHETKDIREHLPERGWYSFQTNSGAEARQHWFITGGMKIVGAVSEADVRKYAKDRGFEEDLPWKMGKAYSEDDAINLEEYMRTTKAMPTPSKEEMRQRIEAQRTGEIDAGENELEVDKDTDSVNIQYSRWTWEESDYVKDREKAADEIATAIGINRQKALDYIDSVNSVSKMIADDQVRLDYLDTGRSPFVSNSEYGGSFDFTTLCKKRRLLTGTFSAIQKALANTALTANEILEIRKMMDDAGLEVSCGKCYVEGSRASMGIFTKEFIDLYKKYNPGKWAPNMAEMNTPDGIEWVRQTHPEVYEQYEYFWNHYGTLKPGDPNLFASQQKPKLYQMRSAYKGEVLEHFKNDNSVEQKNRNGGLRMQSFSDFEIVHLIDAMQVIMDMSRVGLNGQAYTKVPDFAWALGKTGLKINLSIDAWAVEDGQLIFNNKEGMNFNEAMRIRAANSENVGTICCVYDDAQLLAALADDRIDFIIPFHRSQWKKSQYKAMGLPQTTKDYTYQQNEKWLDPSKHTHEFRGRQVKDKCFNYMPNEYWDFSKSGKENAEEYLRMCARDGKRPKFYKFLDKNADGSFSLKADGSTDGYWKLLIDFKMYDNEGNGVPQRPVKPDFNMDEINRMLTTYEGGHEQFPVAHGVVDEFVQKYKGEHPGQTQFQTWEDATQGLNFRDPDGTLLERVFDGSKKYETRTYTEKTGNGKIPAAYLNKPMGIIQTGAGQAKLVGHWELGDGILRDSAWLAEHAAELGNDGTEFEAKPGESKWVYPIKWAEKSDPVPITSRGIRARDITGARMQTWDENMAPEIQTRLMYGEDLRDEVKRYFNLINSRNSNYLSAEQIDQLMEVDPYGNYLKGDMTGADEVMMALSGLTKNMKVSDRAGAYELMDKILQHLSPNQKEYWISGKYEVKDKAFQKWYNEKHPSLYYEGYKPGDLNRIGNQMREIRHLEELLQNKDLPMQDRVEAEQFLDELKNRPQRTYYQKWDEDHNDWAPTFYSKMQNTVNDWTNGKGQKLPPKMAANQVVGWLKGKGVKSEEIRWSGIVPYLEGKKTVTQEELQRVMAENQVQIETKVLQGYEEGERTEFTIYPDFDDPVSFVNFDEVVQTAKDMAESYGFSPASLTWTWSDDGSEIIFEAENEEGKLRYVTSAEVAKSTGNTRWEHYKLENGENYREILFKMPSLEGYTNQAMEVHWGEPNVIAHARIQDMNTAEDKRTLFVEEIQSDLHNAGAGRGFMEASETEARKKAQEIEELYRKMQARTRTNMDRVDKIINSAEEKLLNYVSEKGSETLKGDEGVSALMASMGSHYAPLRNYMLGIMEYPAASNRNGPAALELLNNELLTEEEKTDIKRIQAEQKEARSVYNQWLDMQELQEGRYVRPPDVPFAGSSDTYHEYVMKNLLRMAAEGDYDAIGWTTAWTQADRWSEEYEEGYQIEYDQAIPKFMRKYVKQWGSGVERQLVPQGFGDNEIWYVPVNDAMKQSVLQEGQPLFQRWDETNDDTEAERAARETAYSRLASESAIVEDLLKALETQQAESRAALGELEKKLQLVTTPQVKESSAAKMAGQILQDYNGTVEKAELAAEIKELGDMVLQGASKQALQEKARSIAAEVIDSAEVIEEADAEIYQALHDRIQGAKLTIRPEFLGELNGDFTVLGKKGNRRRNFGPFTLVRTDNTSVDTNQYTSVDQFYTDIQAEFPHLLPAPGEDGAKNEGEYVMLLSSMYDAGQGVAVNPFEQYMGEATEDLTNRLLMDAMSGVLKPEQGAGAFKARKDALNEQIKQLKKEQKLSDKEANNLWNTVYDLSQKLDKAESKYRTLQAEADYRLQQVKAEGEARAVALKAHELSEIAALKAHYREIEQRAKERREESAGFSKYRKQVIEKAGKLYEMMLKNDDKVHVPEVLKQPLGEFLESIDFSSKRSLAGGAETQADQKFGARLMKLQQMLENQQRYLDGDTNAGEDLGGYIDVSPEMMDYLRNMSDLITTAMNTGRTFTVNQMSAEDLKTLSNFLGNLRTAINNMNRFMANARYETVREAAAEDIQSMKQLGSVSGAGTTAAAKLATWQNGTPYYIFKRYGKGGEAIFDGLTRGWEKLAFNAREIINFTEDLYTDKEVKEWTSQIHDITLEDGSTIKITTGQIMSLAMLINREQALKHMNKGGARIGDIKQKGMKGTIQDLTQHHFTDTELQKIIGTLTPRQLEVAQKLQKYMATKGAEWGNEISMRRFGYNFYEEGENYFPIRTMPTDRPMADTDAQQNSMFRLLNLSASKSLNPKANNALVIDDIFDVFSDHMADMAKLNGMGLPILDAIKWFNYKEKLDNGDGTFNTETMQAAMQTAFGDQAGKYFKTLIKDINGMTESGDRGTNLPTKLLSNYKIAAVAANLRVALLQPTAYVRAMTVLSPKYMIGNIPTKAAYEEALKYSGTAGWKDLGYYETDISRGLREKIKHDDTVRDKIAEASMKPAEFGDQMTWATLWKACKRQAKAQNPDAIGNTLMQKTADLFREVIYSSQVMDSTLTRSEIMRGKTMFTKGMSAFMAEPTLSYNILMDAFSKYNLDARRSGGAVAWQRNSGKIGRALAVYACSATFAALVESIADAFRDDDDEEFLEKFTQAFFGEDGKILTGNFAQDLSVLGKIPYVKNFISTLQGYRSTDMSVAALTSVMDVFNIWSETVKLANGELEKATKTTYYGKMTEWGKIYKTLQALSQLSGFAVSNASRDVIAIWNTIMNGRRDDWKIRTYDSGKGDSEEDKIKNKLLKGKMTDQEAVAALMETGKNSKVSRTTVDKWQWEQETGVQFSKLGDAYKAGEITRQQAVAGMKAAGKSDKDIQKAMEDYDFEKKYGAELEGYDLTTAQAKLYYNNGLQNRISLDEYAAQAEEYGTTILKKYYGGNDKTFNSIEDYAAFQSLPIYSGKKEKAAELVKSSGINMQQYASYLEAADTDGNGSVKQDELGSVLKSAISRNEITQDEAEKIWYTLWQSKNTFAKWQKKH